MKKFRGWIGALALLGSTAALLRADDGPTVVQPGVFSYQAPAGWTVQDSALSKYKLSLAPPANGFAANINVVIESAAMTLEQCVATNLKMIQTAPAFQKVQVVSQDPFETAAGIAGKKVVLTDTLMGHDLQQAFYFFDGGSNRKMVITASCLRTDGAADAPAFDAALKSLTLE